MILKLCKGVHCVDLGERFQTRIYLQNFVSIQPRTSPVKFAASVSGLTERREHHKPLFLDHLEGRRNNDAFPVRTGHDSNAIISVEDKI